MIDKDQVKTVLDAVRESSLGLSGVAAGRCTDKCCCPAIVAYLIWTNCVTINNGACEDWDFCQPAAITFNKK